MGAEIREKPAIGLQARLPVGEEDERGVGATCLHRIAPHGTASGAVGPLQAVGGPTDGPERWRLIADPEERLRFETLISDLSARFINLPADDVDREIEDALGRIVQFLGLDRSTLFQLSEDETTLLVSHCWAAPGFESVKGLIPRDMVPWALARVLQGQTIVYSSLDELPEEAARDKATIGRIGPKVQRHVPPDRRWRGRVRGAGVRADDRRKELAGQSGAASAVGFANPSERPAAQAVGAEAAARRSPRSSSSRSGSTRKTSTCARKRACCTTTSKSSDKARP